MNISRWTLLFLVFSFNSFAAKILVYSATGDGKMTLYLETDRLRLDIKGSDKNKNDTVVFLGKEKITYMIDHAKREYFSINEKQLKKMGEMVDSAMAMMKNLPPAMQKKIRAQMGKSATGKKKLEYKYTKVASGQKVKQWVTDKYEVKKGNKVKSEIWAVPFKSVKVNSNDFKIFDSLVKFYTSGSESLSKMAGGSSITAFFDRKAVNGLPVKVLSYEKTKKTFLLDSIKSKSVSKGLYAVPKGYAKRELM